MRGLALAVLLVFVSGYAYAQEADIQQAGVAYLEGSVRPVFVNGCKSGEDRYYLVFGVGDSSGRLLNTRQGRIVNIATAKIDKANVKLDFEDTQGGVYSYDRLEKKKSVLVRKMFRLMSSKDVPDYLNANTISLCE